jgi:hypothetical protein
MNSAGQRSDSLASLRRAQVDVEGGQEAEDLGLPSIAVQAGQRHAMRTSACRTVCRMLHAQHGGMP